MKKLLLNKRAIARLDSPEKIYGGEETSPCSKVGERCTWTLPLSKCQDNTCPLCIELTKNGEMTLCIPCA